MEDYNDRSARPGPGCSDGRPLKVLKFGGTSVGSAARLRRVVEIVRQAALSYRVVVVTSALGGVTNTLASALDMMRQGTLKGDVLAEGLWARHHVLATGVLRPETLQIYENTLRAQVGHLERLVATESGAPGLGDAVLAVGERLAVPLLTLALADTGLYAVPQDAAALVRTNEDYGAGLRRGRGDLPARAGLAPCTPGSCRSRGHRVYREHSLRGHDHPWAGWQRLFGGALDRRARCYRARTVDRRRRVVFG